MKAKPRAKSGGLARVGKVILGAALLAMDQVREKFGKKEPAAKPKAKRAASAKASTAKSAKPVKRKKPASKRGAPKVAKAPKATPGAGTPAKSSARKKAA